MNTLLSIVAVALAAFNIIPQPAVLDVTKGQCNLKRARTEVHISPALKAEAYVLDVTPGHVTITAGSDAGVFYARQTIAQLGEGKVPCVHIEDAPAFDLRAMMLDCSRHFFTVDEVKKVLDLLAEHKINTFHWHLTDDQGWRLEIRKYPLLTQVGGHRKGIASWPATVSLWRSADGKHENGFYTQEQVREIVAYAADRFIEIIPEIEIPGHSTAALASYQYLGCRGEGYEVSSQFGVHSTVYCPGKESTFEFLEGVLDEVMELFPSQYIHIGGDECRKDEWKLCPSCQARIREQGLKDEYALQSYTIRRIEEYVRSKGKRIIGWDEISQGGLSSTAVVLSRYAPERVATALDHGNDVILCEAKYTYFDYYQNADHTGEPPCHIGQTDNLNVAQAYSYDPRSEYTPEQMRQVIGVECCLWTEYIDTFDLIEYKLLPRLDAFSEVAWSQAPKDYEAFRGKLKTQVKRYEKKGMTGFARHALED